MDFGEIINKFKYFLEEKNWVRFPPYAVFIHLIEELGEVGKHILFDIKYKTEEMGHKKPAKSELKRELAQVFSLLLQLSLALGVDLEKAWMDEFELMQKRFQEKY